MQLCLACVWHDNGANWIIKFLVRHIFVFIISKKLNDQIWPDITRVWSGKSENSSPERINIYMKLIGHFIDFATVKRTQTFNTTRLFYKKWCPFLERTRHLVYQSCGKNRAIRNCEFYSYTFVVTNNRQIRKYYYLPFEIKSISTILALIIHYKIII